MSGEFGPNNNNLIVSIWYYIIIATMVSCFVGGVYQLIMFLIYLT